MVRTCLSVVVAGFVAVGMAADANAGWGSWGGSYGSVGGSHGFHGSHGSWGGSSGGDSSGGSWGSQGFHGSSGGHIGIFKRWTMKHKARKAARRDYFASSGGSWGSHGSSGGSSGGSWGGSSGYAYSSHGSSGGSSGGTVIHEEHHDGHHDGHHEAAPADSGDAIIETPPAEGDSAMRRSNNGVLTVDVPEDATVTVNGLETTSTGIHRRYVSKGLDRDLNYRYEVTAVVERDGEKVERTQVTTLRAGQVSSLAFDFDQPEPVETRLTLNVPDDASVFLSGVKTKSTGALRQFATKRIAEGQKWNDYHVVVTVERDGQKLTQEREISINGGDQIDLDFDFNEATLADAR
ncbi:MAG: hypothetical protein CMJ77_18150 [Planctomycetaceae bacterium]|nr:hypothetical protein [Planctomycetaceae bacterium]